MKIEVLGGTIEPCEPFQFLGNNGVTMDFKWHAISNETEESFTFWTRNAAEWWLELIFNHAEWQRRRAALAA